jgi:hypothetical protein
MKRKLQKLQIRYGIFRFPFHPTEDWNDRPFLHLNKRRIGIVVRGTGYIFMPLHNREATRGEH